MEKKHYVDLSDIKKNDLDKTASFTDLMSRTEKKEHERQKEEKTRELKEVLMNSEEKREKRTKEKKRKEIDEENFNELEFEREVPSLENKTTKDVEEEFNKTQKILEFTSNIQTSVLKNLDNNLETQHETKKRGIGNILITDLLIIISLVYYIYSIIFTDLQSNQLYLLIGGCFILSMITLFCLSLISNKILYKIFSILNYLVFISYILFNLTCILKIIII